MNHTYSYFNNSLDNYFENIQKHKNELMEEGFKDKENKNFNIIHQKINILDTLLKNILKFKSLNSKIVKQVEKEKLEKILGKK
jgi:hypothetical protein